MSLVYLHDVFVGRKCHFLTVKGVKPREQMIGFVNDLCRKICKTYVIIREKNKKSDGYHFHALLRNVQGLKKTWYKKGCHMHMTPVGKNYTLPSYTFSEGEIVEVPSDILQREMYVDRCNEKIGRTGSKLMSNDVDLIKILLYMSKEMEHPVQYHDYILCVAGKQLPLYISEPIAEGEEEAGALLRMEQCNATVPDSLEGVGNNQLSK